MCAYEKCRFKGMVFPGEQIKIDEFPDLSVSISVGIAYAPNNGKSYIELSKCADKALYETKKNGKNGYTVYSE